MNTCAGTNIHDKVGTLHRFLVVLHHDNGVSEVSKLFERGDQLAVISLMKTYTGLVENIKHADERRAYLCGKANALCLAARKCPRASGEREISKTDAGKKAKARTYLL